MRPAITLGIGFLVAGSVVTLSGTAGAAPVRFTRDQEDGRHYYEVVRDDQIKFERAGEASVAAAAEPRGVAIGARRSFLATINSAEEQAFIESLLQSSGAPTGAYWFGLAKAADPNVFVYINGDPFGPYQNFAPGQPDSKHRESKFVILWAADDITGPGAPTLARRGGWADVPAEGYPIDSPTDPGPDEPDMVRGGYVIEYVAVPLPMAALAVAPAAVLAGLFARRLRRR